MNNAGTKKIVANGLMIALVFLATYFTRIPGPIPPGYINFGDVVIMLAAVLLGKNSGFVAGSIGSAIADLAAGAPIFAPITFIVKGLEGYIVGSAAFSAENDTTGEVRRIAAMIAGAAVMVAGYFLAEWLILSIFDKTFGYVAAITELPLNLVQGGVSAAVGYVLSAVLIRAGMQKALN